MDDESGGSLPVVATYREIAQHFGLNGANAARTKAKRAKWEEEPTNHPSDTKRIKVPRDAWDGAGEPPRSPRRESRSSFKVKSPSHAEPTEPSPPSQEGETLTLKALEGALTTLREQVAKAEARADGAEARADRAETATDHERRAREQDRAAAAEREAWLKGQMEVLRAELAESRAAAAALESAAPTPPTSEKRSFLARLLGR